MGTVVVFYNLRGKQLRYTLPGFECVLTNTNNFNKSLFVALKTMGKIFLELQQKTGSYFQDARGVERSYFSTLYLFVLRGGCTYS